MKPRVYKSKYSYTATKKRFMELNYTQIGDE